MTTTQLRCDDCRRATAAPSLVLCDTCASESGGVGCVVCGDEIERTGYCSDCYDEVLEDLRDDVEKETERLRLRLRDITDDLRDTGVRSRFIERLRDLEDDLAEVLP